MLVTPKHDSVTTQTSARPHWLWAEPAGVLVITTDGSLGSLIIFGCFHESLIMVILDLDLEFQLATGAFYLASVTTVLRGKDVANGSQWEKKNLIDKILVTGLQNRSRGEPKPIGWNVPMGTVWFQCICGVPTIGTFPNTGIWSTKNINSKLLIHWFSIILFSDEVRAGPGRMCLNVCEVCII